MCRARGRGQGGGAKSLKIGGFSIFDIEKVEILVSPHFGRYLRFGCERRSSSDSFLFADR